VNFTEDTPTSTTPPPNLAQIREELAFMSRHAHPSQLSRWALIADALLWLLPAGDPVEASSPRNPVLHTHVERGLPDGHPYAGQAVYCQFCRDPLHASTNECLQTWVETGRGPYCLEDFTNATGQVVDDDWSLR
jgi:hypothetical protein